MTETDCPDCGLLDNTIYTGEPAVCIRCGGLLTEEEESD